MSGHRPCTRSCGTQQDGGCRTPCAKAVANQHHLKKQTAVGHFRCTSRSGNGANEVEGSGMERSAAEQSTAVHSSAWRSGATPLRWTCLYKSGSTKLAAQSSRLALD
eukprot:362672-Chlamydomonas_euryale.AAC.12